MSRTEPVEPAWRCYALDRVERLRDHLAAGRTLYAVRDDGQGGRHWQAVACGDPEPFAADREPPAFSARPFALREAGQVQQPPSVAAITALMVCILFSAS